MGNAYGHAWHWNNKWNWGSWGQAHPNYQMMVGGMGHGMKDHHDESQESHDHHDESHESHDHDDSNDLMKMNMEAKQSEIKVNEGEWSEWSTVSGNSSAGNDMGNMGMMNQEEKEGDVSHWDGEWMSHDHGNAGHSHGAQGGNGGMMAGMNVDQALDFSANFADDISAMMNGGNGNGDAADGFMMGAGEDMNMENAIELQNGTWVTTAEGDDFWNTLPNAGSEDLVGSSRN